MIAFALLAAAALVGLTLWRRSRRPRLPPAPSWSVRARLGLQVRFSCGHEDHRAADFMRSSVHGQARFHRKVWRCHAERSLCHDCFVVRLAEDPQADPANDPQFCRIETPRR